MFELDYNEAKLKVEEHTIAGSTVFRIVFPDRRVPLIITSVTRKNAPDFWTSIPEGRQEEATAIGALISEHLKENA